MTLTRSAPGVQQRVSGTMRACTDAAESAELTGRVGEEFDAIVVDDRGDKGTLVALAEPAILAPCTGHAEPGTSIRVRLTTADVATRTVAFAVAT